MAKRDKKRVRRWVAGICLVLFCAYALLLIPEPTPPSAAGAGKQPFIWSQPQFWADLEERFVQARSADRSAVSNEIASLVSQSQRVLSELDQSTALDPRWSELETNLFGLAPLVAADSRHLRAFAGLISETRRQAKRQSARWDLSSQPTRDRLYRIFFGSRMALEQVLVQGDGAGLPPECDSEPSQTPSVLFQGTMLHSGDILVSRGGAPTSSLISRGNDYAGVFSHVSLLHVDPATGAGCVIQALIEKGVVVTSLNEYARDRKLRLMVLRPRADLTAVVADPQLPHKAAAWALQKAMARHIPYDFAMDYRDHSAMFCSEVASAAYGEHGIHLWMGISHISSPVVTGWLGSLGVRHFETQEPADLEYDPQLRIVAEWREVSALQQAHMDDAVTDVMLAEGKPGQPLPYSHFKLPFARAAKAWSAVMNSVGQTGPIPEGMSATMALRVAKYKIDHLTLKTQLAARAAAFQEENNYSPPYWELIRLASRIREEQGRSSQAR